MSNNLNQIGAMKQEVLQAILSDDEIMRLILNRPDPTLPALTARYVQVVPWKKIPDTQTNARVYVTFDIVVTEFVNCAVKNYNLYLWIMAHDSLMTIDSTVGAALGIQDRGVRTDILADKIDYLLNGSTEMGFGKLQIKSSGIFDPADGYYGRNLVYEGICRNRYGEKL